MIAAAQEQGISAAKSEQGTAAAQQEQETAAPKEEGTTAAWARMTLGCGTGSRQLEVCLGVAIDNRLIVWEVWLVVGMGCQLRSGSSDWMTTN